VRRRANWFNSSSSDLGGEVGMYARTVQASSIAADR
jgi:hypothetical protein